MCLFSVFLGLRKVSHTTRREIFVSREAMMVVSQSHSVFTREFRTSPRTDNVN